MFDDLLAISLFSATLAGLLIFRIARAGAAEAPSREGRARRTIGSQKAERHSRRLPPPRDDERLDLRSIDIDALRARADVLNESPSAGAKRRVDVVLSLLALVVLSPVLALTALAIWAESRGPILYRQKRIGRDGVCFDVFKFRSMIMEAEPNGPQFATRNDKRITAVGHFIRRLRIDELPQTINVLRGEMSLIGPRPERPEFVDVLALEIPHYNARHMVKPGITGWAQVKYEYTASLEGAREKLRYDLYYIENYSIGMDIEILLRTVRVVLCGLGSR